MMLHTYTNAICNIPAVLRRSFFLSRVIYAYVIDDFFQKGVLEYLHFQITFFIYNVVFSVTFLEIGKRTV